MEMFCDVSMDKSIGAYIGAALGDAFGGPVEGWHAQRIKNTYGRIDRLLPYPSDWVFPAFAIHQTPGCVTDDTYIRRDVARYVLSHQERKDRTPKSFAEYLTWNIDIHSWWNPPMDLLRAIHCGEVSAEHAGNRMGVGGRIGSWTPLALIHPGNPGEAATEVETLGSVYKTPFERNIAAAVQAGTAAAIAPGSTADDIVCAIMDHSGPTAKRLFERAIYIASHNMNDLDTMVAELYAHCLVDWKHFDRLREVDDPMPPEDSKANPNIEEQTFSAFFAEQAPLALAAFLFGKGDFLQTMIAGTAIGRDNDSILTSAGGWVGGLVGLGGIPREMVNTVISVNKAEVDLLGDAWALTALSTS